MIYKDPPLGTFFVQYLHTIAPPPRRSTVQHHAPYMSDPIGGHADVCNLRRTSTFNSSGSADGAHRSFPGNPSRIPVSASRTHPSASEYSSASSLRGSAAGGGAIDPSSTNTSSAARARELSCGWEESLST